MRIQDVLQGQNLVTIGPDETVTTLLRLMKEHNIGAVVVSSDHETVAGIASERDVVRHLADAEDAVGLLGATVGSLMTTAVRTCSPGDTTGDLMQLMTTHRVRHLPVVDDGRLTGIVSIGDVVKARIDELAFERDQLDAYVNQG